MIKELNDDISICIQCTVIITPQSISVLNNIQAGSGNFFCFSDIGNVDSAWNWFNLM